MYMYMSTGNWTYIYNSYRWSFLLLMIWLIQFLYIPICHASFVFVNHWRKAGQSLERVGLLLISLKEAWRLPHMALKGFGISRLWTMQSSLPTAVFLEWAVELGSYVKALVIWVTYMYPLPPLSLTLLLFALPSGFCLYSCYWEGSWSPWWFLTHLCCHLLG